MADHKALSTVLQQTISLQPLPEEERNPKQRMRDLHQTSPCCDPLREVYRKLAEVLDMDQITVRCPVGFGVFKDRAFDMFQWVEGLPEADF